MPIAFNNLKNKVPTKTKASKDWHLIEFYMPIKESVNAGGDFIIKGIAINETTTRNGITYRAKELKLAAPSFRNKPIMVDHSGSVKDIVGRTTENVVFNSANNSIDFEAKIMDEKIKEMINDGRITDVSIGAQVENIIENEEGERTAIGLEGLEISLVAIPGDPGANLANALDTSFQIKESLNIKENDVEDIDTELNNDKEGKMEEAETKTEEIETKDDEKKDVAEEKVKETIVKVDMSEVNATIKALSEQVATLTKKVVEQDETPAPAEKKAEDEILKTPVEDETKGDVGEREEETEEAEEGYVVEKAETGKGLQLYRDYSQESGKFNRLCR